MRLAPHAWTKMLGKLGKKAVLNPRRKFQQRSFIEALEPRQLFTVISATNYDGGNCIDGCLTCECSPASATKGGDLTTSNGSNGDGRAYNSQVNPHPLIRFTANEYLFSESQPSDYYLKAYVTFAGTQLSDVWHFDAPDAGGDYAFSFQVDASSISTGRYEWEVYFEKWEKDSGGDILQGYTRFVGYQNVINRLDSAFGVGWQSPEVDRLYVINDDPTGTNPNQYFSHVPGDGVLVVTGNNQSIWFGENGSGGYKRETTPYSFATLTAEGGGFTLRNPDGTGSRFNSSGLLIERFDRHDNAVRSYTYNGSNQITDIEDIGGRITHFEYDGDLVESATDFHGVSGAAQTTSYDYDDDDRLIEVVEPDPDGAGPLSSPVTRYGYDDVTGLLTSVIDPRGLETTVTYDDTRKVSQIQERCGGTIVIDSVASQLLVDPDDFDRDTLAPLVLEEEIFESRTIYGNQWLIQRNHFGDFTYLEDPAEKVTTFQYDDYLYDPYVAGNGLLDKTTHPDPDGGGPLFAWTSYTDYSFYTNTGRVYTITHPDGLRSETVYQGSLTTTEAGTIDVMTQQFDGIYNTYFYYDEDDPNDTETFGDLVKVVRLNNGDDRYGDAQADSVTLYTYTDGTGNVPGGLVETITDSQGRVTRYEYDRDLVALITYAEGTPEETTVEYEYDLRDRVSAMIDGLGRRTEYVYDNLDRLIQQTDPDPDGLGPLARPVTKYRYDASSNQTHVTDPLGRVTETAYDVRDRAFQVIQPVADPDVTPAVTTKDDGQYTSQTGSWSTVSRSGAYGGNVRVSSTDGASTTFTFSSLDADKKYGVLVRWVPSATPDEYDTNALVEVFGNTGSDPLNELRVDLNSKPQGMPDGSSLMWLSLGAFSPYSNTLTLKLSDDDTNGKLVIDAVRLVEVGPVTQSVFDCAGNLVSTTDALGHMTAYEYDELNRLIERTDPNPGSGSPVTQYTYNALGWLTSMTDAEDNVTVYTHDALGRVTQEIKLLDEAGLQGEYFASVASSLNYVPSMNPDQLLVDDKIEFAGATGGTFGDSGYADDFTVRWSGAIDIAVAGTTVFYLYTAGVADLYIDGKLVLQNSSGDILQEYSTNNVVLSAGWHSIDLRYVENDTTHGIILKYDLPGASPKEVIPATAFAQAQVTQTEYDAIDRIDKTFDPRGRLTDYTFDALNHQTQVMLPDPDPLVSGDQPIYNTVYDALGNVLAEVDPLGEKTLYTYDALNRQTQVIQPLADPGVTPFYDILQEDDASLSGSWETTPISVYTSYGSMLEADAVGAGATFTFENLTDTKQYAVLIHWGVDPTDLTLYDSDALLEIYGDLMADPLHVSRQNLNLPVQGVISDYYGSTWKTLGAFHPDSGELSLVISDDNDNGLLTIDAVQIIEVGPVTTYTYDAAGQLTSLIDPVGNTTSWVYDGLNRTIEETNELNATRYFQYDAVGNLTRAIDRNGRITRYEYDRLYRQTEETWQEDGVGDKIKGRYVFYNNSSYDGNNAAANADDDDAIAPDKTALLPGESATAANVTNFSSGLNGIMIDILEVGTLSASDFVFNAGDSQTPSSWSTVNGANVSISVREDAGQDGSDRVTILFNNGEVSDEWLQVTVKANGNTGLTTEDVFYFANLQGDYDYDYDVDGADFVVYQSFSGPVDITTGPDGNKDGDVDGADFVIWQTIFPHTMTKLDAPADLARTISYEYDNLGRLLEVTDRNGASAPASADYVYEYDALSRVSTLTQTLVGLTPAIVFFHGYDEMSRRTIQVATIGGTTDFLNLYVYDARGRLERLDQSWVTGNVVAIKRVDFSYNLAGQFQSINRYADYSGTQLVVQSTYGYDGAGRLTSLLHQAPDTSHLATYAWQWDNANRITEFTNSQHTGENVDYDYDNSGQLVGADYDVLGDEDYTYDDNGNRQQATQPTSSPPEGIWNFNEGSGSSVADGSGNGHTGTINGSPTWSSDMPSAGLGEYSLLLNDSNSEYVSVGSNLLTGDFTVSLFFKAQNAGGLQILFWQGETQLYLTGGKLTGRVFNTSGQSVVVTHPTTLANNTWYHAVLRFDGDTVSVALDGDVESSAFSHVNKTIIPGQVYINRDETATSGMAGRLADVRLYDRAITDVEIEQIVDGHPDQAVNSYSTGANNRLDSDGTFDYEYDGEGNLIKRTEISSGDYRVLEWDHRNRLASISDYDDTHALQQKFSYIYDAFDRLVGKRSDTDGNGTINATEAYVYDGDQIVLRFADDDAAALAAADLTNRYLWGPNVDQLLAEENVTSLGSAGTVDWALTDHLGTIRDWARYNAGSTTILDHAEVDAFGNRLDAPSVDSVFGYTARYRDADTGLQWNGSEKGGGRWYDSSTGRWLSEDSIGFNGDRFNLYRYVSNAPTIHTDPDGLKVYLHCSKVKRFGITLGRHCAVIACCGTGPCACIRIDGGGEEPDPAKPMPTYKCGKSLEDLAKGGVVYEVQSKNKSCEEDKVCLSTAFVTSVQSPYGRLGPNSNTYAHDLLIDCNMRFKPNQKGCGHIPYDAPGWNCRGRPEPDFGDGIRNPYPIFD